MKPSTPKSLACAGLLWLFSQPAFSQKSRGEYLTVHVAMCVQCHSPRNQQGELIEAQLFTGAPIPFAPRDRDWAVRAPRIARLPGSPGWTEEEFIRFLQTGVRPDGTRPSRPMPPFRMNREDAAAIADFLKSLNTSKGI